MHVAILGSGYAGKAVCSKMLSCGHTVTISTRAHSKLSSLPGYPFLLDTSNLNSYDEFLRDKDALLISVAPGFQETYEDTYLNTAKMLRKINPLINSIVYLSSTSVYAEESGNFVDEDSPLYQNSGNRQILINAEKEFLKLPQTIIFRLGEIYGPEREISTKIRNAKKALPGNGERFTNMIHLEDIVSATYFSIEHSLSGVFNLVDDDHPRRNQLYMDIAKEFSLAIPEWSNNQSDNHRGNKKVSNEKIKRAGYEFLHPHRALI